MAVYTQVSDTQLNEFIARYDIGSVQRYDGLVEGVENTNYHLVTDQGEYILTLYEQRVDPAQLPFFFLLLDHLDGKGFPCPAPIRQRSGEHSAILADRHAALFPFVRGTSTTSPGIRNCRQVGRILAQLHHDGSDFTGPRHENALGLNGWNELFNKCKDDINDIVPGIREEIEQVLENCTRQWPTDLPRGICHTDLFTDNVLFSNDQIGAVIDFYFACEELLIYDLAVTINAWSISPFGSFYYSNSRAVIKGYEELRPISDGERAHFLLMMQASAVRFLLTRLYDWISTPADAVVKRKDPMEYVRNLRFNLRQDSIAFYGFDDD